MRAMLAIDGSASSDAARRLVDSLPWPDGSVIRVVGVIPRANDFTGLAAPMPLAHYEGEDVVYTERILDEAVATLGRPGRAVERRILDGRPASAIVRAARDFRAEVIVVGSRGLGRIGSMLLGSVSAEIVDHAPCPVLVARSDAITSILLAVDGSESSKRAVTHLGGARYLADRRIEVLAVGSGHASPMPLTTPELTDEVTRVYTERVSESRHHAEDIAAGACEELLRDRRDARWSISTGDAAHEIIQAAADLGCDLIVMGSRGHTGLTRVLLGSVARNVLLHAHASVLIVREPLRERAPKTRPVVEVRRALAAAG